MASRFPANPAWYLYHSDDLVSVWVNENENIHMKAKIKGGKTKQFYKETSHNDISRWLADETGYLKYWDLFM